MRVRFAAILLVCLLLCPAMALAQEDGGGGIVYGSELGVLVSAPDGWVFDSKSGLSEGLCAVMYPKGSTWSNAVVMMYVNVCTAPNQDLDSFIAGDIERFKENSPNIVAENAEPISVGVSKAEVRLFSGDKWGNYEYVAYAKKGNSVAIYVMSSRTKEGLTRSIQAFRTMVSTSILMNVTIQK